MIGIKKNTEGLVTYTNREYDGNSNLIVVKSIPEQEEREGYGSTLYYINGELVYRYQKLPPFEPIPEPIPPVVPYDEQVEVLIRQRYSVSEEFSLLRQRETKPEEYQGYFNYAEECKIEAKETITSTKQ